MKKASKKASKARRTTKPPASAAPVKKTEVKITAAKGRPMLTWVGKRPLSHVIAFPAQHIETFSPSPSPLPQRGEGWGEGWRDWPAAYPKGGLLFHGDNKEVLAHLLANGFRGKVNLIYIDPPFDSGADYVRKVSLRSAKGTAKLDGESYTLGEQIQYTDIWANDNYLQFMYERLLLIKELLAEDGSIWLHCDPGKSYHLRCLLDETFGANTFQNEIIWQRQTAHSDSTTFGFVHDTIFWYSKSPFDFKFSKPHVPYSHDYLESHYSSRDENGRRFTLRDLNPPRGQGPVYTFRGFTRPWRFTEEKMKELDAQGKIYQSEGSVPRLKVYLEETKGMPVQDIWLDINPINSQAKESEDFPTQKPEALLERIVRASSNAGGLVLDCFIGSGTTAAIAQKLGRRWIGCDINKGAVQTTAKRLQTILQEQIEAQTKRPLTLPFPSSLPSPQRGEGEVEGDQKDVPPVQLAFTVWRVNDYDLAIQHNEAVNLACEHIGIQRTRTDAYFDGTLGKSLVKIIPFGHPLTPLDLEELKRELDARPDEDRPITLVCLGMELAAKAWIEDWNRLRKGKEAINRISVIELRTDPRYGKFIQHEPARAKVTIARKKGKLQVEVEDFISPTILERLAQQAGVLKPKIDDWRAMVDCVMIDPAYDGQVFNVAVSDVPEKKSDLVAGRYEMPEPNGKSTVAVKVIDMLGEEVLVTQKI